MKLVTAAIIIKDNKILIAQRRIISLAESKYNI